MGGKPKIIMPGTMIPHYGKVGAVLCLAGERYYMLHDKSAQCVSLMPAAEIERLSRRKRVRRGAT